MKLLFLRRVRSNRLLKRGSPLQKPTISGRHGVRSKVISCLNVLRSVGKLQLEVHQRCRSSSFQLGKRELVLWSWPSWLLDEPRASDLKHRQQPPLYHLFSGGPRVTGSGSPLLGNRYKSGGSDRARHSLFFLEAMKMINFKEVIRSFISGKKKTDIVGQLPVEVAQNILRSLDSGSLLNVAQVSHKWLAICKGDPLLRRRLLRTLRKKRSLIPNCVFLFLQYALLGNLYVLSCIINLFS